MKSNFINLIQSFSIVTLAFSVKDHTDFQSYIDQQSPSHFPVRLLIHSQYGEIVFHILHSILESSNLLKDFDIFHTLRLRLRGLKCLVLTTLQWCATAVNTVNPVVYSRTLKFLLCFAYSAFSPPPHKPLGDTDLFTIFLVLSLPECHVFEIIDSPHQLHMLISHRQCQVFILTRMAIPMPHYYNIWQISDDK